MAATYQLRRRREQTTEVAALLGLMVLAFFGHLLLVFVLWVGPGLLAMVMPPPPEPEVIEVSLLALKHSDNDMSEMDVMTAQPAAPVDTEAPDPVQDDAGVADEGITEPIETPNPSDLEFTNPEAPEQKKGDPDRRKQLMEQMEREAKRSALLGALGTEESEAGDPDSTSDRTINLGGSGRADPALARYIDQVSRTYLAKFHPLPALKSHEPGYVTRITVRFDVETGTVQTWSIWKSSGNKSWDGAAERAVDEVKKVPVPPESIRETLKGGMVIKFSADDI